MKIVLSFLGAFIATVGYAIFFNTSRKILPWVGITGAVGWILNTFLISKHISSPWAYMVSALTVAFLGEYFAIKTKNPATVFSIPGIYPLVPGYSLYTTMYYFTGKEIQMGMTAMVDTLTKAGAIAVGIILMSSLSGIRKNIKHNELSRDIDKEPMWLDTEELPDNMFE